MARRKVLFVKGKGRGRFNWSVTPPLGILHLSSALRKDKGWDIRVLDLRLERKSQDVLAAHLKDFEPDIVGISAITMEAKSLHDAAQTVRRYDPSIRVVAGGPHATSYPEDVLAGGDVDCAVLGEGEATVGELFGALMEGSDLEGVKGIAFQRDGKTTVTASRPFIEDLDSLPFPAWDLIDLNRYSHRQSMAPMGWRKYAGLFTSRACPYQCAFCHKIFGKKFRARSPEAVIEHIRYLYSTYGIKHFEFYDDIFNLDVKRSKAIFNLIRKENVPVKFSFPNGLRADLLDKEQLELMKSAGVNFISVAVETATPRLQTYINKNLNLEKVRNIIDQCRDLNIFTRGFFMLGFPTETREEILNTIDYACSSSLNMALFFIVVPFKGTDLWKMCQGKFTCMNTNFRNFDYLVGPFNMSQCPDDELFRLQQSAVGRFNFNVKRLWRNFWDHPNKEYYLYNAFYGLAEFFTLLARGTPA